MQREKLVLEERFENEEKEKRKTVSICLVGFSILIKRPGQFSILGVSGVLFHFILFLIEIPVGKQYRP